LAFEYARHGYVMTQQERYLEIAVQSIRRREAGPGWVEMLQPWVEETFNSGMRSRRNLLGVRLSLALGEPEFPPGILENIEHKSMTENDLRYIAESLLKAGRRAELDTLLVSASRPDTLYYRSVLRQEEGRMEEAAADWERALSGFASPPERRPGRQEEMSSDSYSKGACFRLAERLAARGDARAEDLWELLLRLAPSDTMQDANAHFHLARLAESREQWMKSVRHYEDGLSLAQHHGGAIRIPVDEAGGMIDSDTEGVRKKISSLRERAEAATVP
jgi:tetratricopeptide (TPR) repeat protein